MMQTRTVQFKVALCAAAVLLLLLMYHTLLVWRFYQPRKLQLHSAVIDCVSGENYRKSQMDVDDFNLVTDNQINLPARDETNKQRQSVFSSIFTKKIWFRYNGVGNLLLKNLSHVQSSGTGSTWAATEGIRKTLDHVIAYIKQTTMKPRISLLDAPCGDMVWMNKYLKGRNDIDYTGIDIVEDLINIHKETFKNETNWRFYHHDLAKKPLESSYDMIHSRQMLQHLTDLDTLKIMQHFSSSGSLFLLASTYPNQNSNGDLTDLGVTRFRPQNLELPPFSLHPPKCMHRDAGNPPLLCYAALWRLPLGQAKSRCTNRVKSVPLLQKWKYYHCG